MAGTASGNVYNITSEQAEMIREYALDRGWEIGEAPYTFYRIAGDKLSIIAYKSGKLVVQGKNAGDFISFFLEPQVLKTWGANVPQEGENKEEFSPHGGVDESGKGDFFGPLVIAGCYVNEETAALLRELGVCDSKQVSSSQKIIQLAKGIRRIVGTAHTVVMLKPETYNRLYSEIGNLNRLLAWGHARVIENLLTAVPDCPRMLSDKFGNEALIRRALMTKGRTIKLDQQVRAESDVAVAAASILARDGFLYAMNKLSEEIGIELPRGGGGNVRAVGRKLMAEHGPQIFEKCAKLHFKTYGELLENHR